VTDAYNAPGYWDFLSIRGFTLDNRFNYRREGLPISAETSIPLDNKERIEILKGTSGIQAGTSAPGGLVNYVVKRPTAQTCAARGWRATSRASVLAAAGYGRALWRTDQAVWLPPEPGDRSRCAPSPSSLDGQRQPGGLATDWRINTDSACCRPKWNGATRSPAQPGRLQPAGQPLPAPVDPRMNLNNQPWSQPGV
jgi:iron complex outermembrane receptor protein